MDHDKQIKEIEMVIESVLKTMEEYEHIGKMEFESILQQVMKHVHENTGLDTQKIAAATNKVLNDLPKEYGQLNDDARSWEALIGYIYAKYLKVLNKL